MHTNQSPRASRVPVAKKHPSHEESIWSVDTYSVCVGDPYNDY